MNGYMGDSLAEVICMRTYVHYSGANKLSQNKCSHNVGRAASIVYMTQLASQPTSHEPPAAEAETAATSEAAPETEPLPAAVQPAPVARLSPTRQKILKFIQRFTAEHNYPPSVREIAAAIGINSPATIHRHIGILEAEGKLRRDKNRKRALVLTEPNPEDSGASGQGSSPAPPQVDHLAPHARHLAPPEVELDATQLVDLMTYRQTTQLVPLVGHIAAGQGTIAEQNIEGTMAVPTDICGTGDFFVLRVRGDSMAEAAILDGDYVVARQQATANNGDIVVAGINEDEATVKRFKLSGSPPGSTITLMPENEGYSPTEFPASAVAIYGKVVSVLRRL